MTKSDTKLCQPARIVFATLLLGALLSGCSSTPETPASVSTEKLSSVEATKAQPTPVPEPVAERQPPEGTIIISAAGDIMLGTDYPANRLPDDDGVSFLQHVTPLLQQADVAFGNLEGVLLDGGEPEKTCSNPKACYLFRSPTRYAQLLADAGFDAMSLANNHALDFGEVGRDSSMLALSQAGIHHSGREGDIASWEHNGWRIGLIAFSPTKGSFDLIDYHKFLPLIQSMAESNDVLIVSFHGGAEGKDGVERLAFGMEHAYGERRGDVVDFSRAMVDAGADLVIGHGPHIPRAMEIYQNRLIAYSLGNFATYYGISVAGSKGYAPLLTVELNNRGEFNGGQIDSFVQRRPGGPAPDTKQRAMNMIKELSRADFPDTSLVIDHQGTLSLKATP